MHVPKFGKPANIGTRRADVANAELLFRLVTATGSIEVFDARVTVTERRIGLGLSDEVAHLAQLRERGVLTDEEFKAAKQRLLAIAS